MSHSLLLALRAGLRPSLLAGGTLLVLLASPPSPAHALEFYVTAGGTGAQNGLNWDNALPTVSAGLTLAQPGDTIYVWAGVYHERLTLKPGVKVSGGYFFGGAWLPFWSFLDGDNGGSVVTVPAGAGPTTILEGFTIQNGSGNYIGADTYGGGIFCIDASPTLRYNHITGCHATAGGGLYLVQSSADVNTSHFTNNQASEGGAVFCTQSAPMISICTFRRNVSETAGGAILVYSSPNIIIGDNVFEANRATDSGSAVQIDGGLLLSNTFLRNTGTAKGALGLGNASPLVVANTVIAGNRAGVWALPGAALLLSHNDIFGNTAGNYSGVADPTGTNGNISKDPALADPLAGDYTPCPGSPCVDQGDDALIPAGAIDYYYQARIQGAGVDIGAAEWPQPAPKPAVHVKPGGDDAKTGDDWQDAKATITAAASKAAATGREVWVAAGTYKQRVSLNGNAMLFGGFSGSETARNQRDPEKNVTIIDAQGLPFSETVIYIPSGNDRRTVIDGFTIRNGTTGHLVQIQTPLGQEFVEYGGGIYMKDATPIISNNIIESCDTYYTRGKGGGIYISNPGLTNYDPPYIACNTIRNNSSNDGGGLFVESSSILIRNNNFDNNGAIHTGYSAGAGGGMSLEYATATITGNRIYDNSGQYAGGIDASYGVSTGIRGNRIEKNHCSLTGAGVGCTGDAQIVNNVFLDNTSDFNTAGLNISGGTATVANNLFSGNIAYYHTADLTATDASVMIANNTFTGSGGRAIMVEVTGNMPGPFTSKVANNIVTDAPVGIKGLVAAPSTLTLTNNCFFTTEDYQNIAPGTTDMHADPHLTSVFEDGFWQSRLRFDSPCIDAGADALATGDWDVDGQPRIQGPHVDLGAYEYVAGGGVGLQGVATALRIAGGMEAADPAAKAALNVEDTGTSQGKVDIRDAVRLLRIIAGVESGK